jgi:hypothetical protein
MRGERSKGSEFPTLSRRFSRGSTAAKPAGNASLLTANSKLRNGSGFVDQADGKTFVLLTALSIRTVRTTMSTPVRLERKIREATGSLRNSATLS